MTKHNIIWLGLGAYALAQAAPLALDGDLKTASGFFKSAQADSGQGGEGGEQGDAGEGDKKVSTAPEGGEGGEGGEAGDGPDLSTDDVAYLTQLALIEGHLLVGVRLYRAGEKSGAESHMKHPGDELYSALKPAFAARKVRGFDDGLEALAKAVEGGASVAEVDDAYAGVTKKIAAARGGTASTPNTTLLVASHLVREAAEEYAIGVKGGKVVNVHEYQDSLGFVGVAGQLVQGAGASEPVTEAAAELAKLASAWPGLVPPDTLSYDVSLMHGVAARIELLAQQAK